MFFKSNCVCTDDGDGEDDDDDDDNDDDDDDDDDAEDDGDDESEDARRAPDPSSFRHQARHIVPSRVMLPRCRMKGRIAEGSGSVHQLLLRHIPALPAVATIRDATTCVEAGLALVDIYLIAN
jgi:hypothetical protein